MHRILLASYRDVIMRSGSQAISSSDVVIGTEGRLSLRYIPFEHVARQATLVIVGITPGTTQLKAAYDAFQSVVHAGGSDAEGLASAKDAGAFAGAMRTNLVRMLEHFDIHRRLGLSSARDLWDGASHLLHSTSVVPHAAFVDGGLHFNDRFDVVMSSALLRDSFEQDFVRSLPLLRADAQFIALGPTPRDALLHCAAIGAIRREQILGMFPHPSGSSGSQVRYFVRDVGFDELAEKDPTRRRATRLDDAYAEILKSLSHAGPTPTVPVANVPRAIDCKEKRVRRSAGPNSISAVDRAPASVTAGRGREGIHTVVARGKDAGLVLYPDGCYVVSTSRFEEQYVRVTNHAELPRWLTRGYSLRMSNKLDAPKRGAALIKPDSIRGWARSP
jgi:hypothetical protein